MVVANQAVYVFFLAKVEFGAVPAITGMAAGAACPVALNANAEVIDLVLFANGDGFVTAGQHNRGAFPCPMDSLCDLVGGVFVTFQAGAGHIGAGFKGACNQVGVVYVWRADGNVYPGVIGSCCVFGDKKNSGQDND